MHPEVFGPSVLGRGLLLSPGQKVPAHFSEAPVVDIDDATLKAPASTADQLHELWVKRQPVVVRLAVDPGAFKAAAREIDDREPWEVGTSFLFHVQRLHFLAWNNNWDMRSGEPVWWWAKKAINLGAAPGSTADITLADGTEAFCDGGPLMPLPLDVALVPYSSVETGSLRPMSMRETGAELAADQRAAVAHAGGAARIIAPAGSGKTRVLTERLRHVLSDWNVEPSAVCAVAYNTRAAAELTERTSGLPAHIRTLNSLAFAIVNGSGGFKRSALEPQSRNVISERDVRNILQDIVTVPRKTNTDPMAGWIEAISAVRLGLRSPVDVADDWPDLEDFAESFRQYRVQLNDQGLLDFDEQIYRAIEILLQDPDARAVAQRRCRMLLVDEFQDLTPAHVLMLRLLALPALDVFGVGDDDQVIYGYAGADPDYLVSFGKWFTGAQHHPLEINYRCPPGVVTAASNMLTRNGVRVAKDIHPRPGSAPQGRDLTVTRVPSEQLAENAIDTIGKWIADGCEPDSIAVLTRVNVTLLPVQVLLAEAGIAHTTPVDASVLERTGMRTALAYLRIGLNPGAISRSDITDTVRRPSRKIARNVVDMMTKKSRNSIANLKSLTNSLSGNDGDRVRDYVSDLEAIVDALRAGGTEAALATIRDEIGLGETMDTLDGSRRQVDRSAHGDDLAALVAVAHLHSDASTFEPWLRSVLQTRSDAGGVELSTVHRVKGREWDRVLVFDVSRDLMPHRLSSDVAEERRVFHVAITRCREQVVVMADASKPSKFIAEMNAPGKPDVVAPPVRVTSSAKEPAKAPTQAKIPAAVGMEISVNGGQIGVVQSADDDGALISIGKAQTRIPYGSVVRVGGKQYELLPPRSESAERIFNALKEWRTAVAREHTQPAYTVLHDAHLEGIAALAPLTLAELGKCKGVGEAKLDRWGDEILSIVESAR